MNPNRLVHLTASALALAFTSCLPTHATIALVPKLDAPLPPSWLDKDAMWLLPQLDGAPEASRGPNVRALGAIVADLDRGEVLWARKPDAPVPVASLTKMLSALTLVSVDPSPDLQRTWCVTPELWPPKPGARSSFETGVCHEGWDFLGAALVHSDNRGAMALPWLAGLPYGMFIDAMNDTAADLGVHGHWEDPTGLGNENRASPRDMLKIVVALAEHPWLPTIASSPAWEITRDHGTQFLGTTNRLLGRYETIAAKTGYTDDAHYCYAAVVRTEAGAHLAVVVLASPTTGARFDDAERMIAWADSLER